MRLSAPGLLAVVVAISPAAGAAVQPAEQMETPRAAHTATLLGSGEVLIAGGCAVTGCELDDTSATTELYDPASSRFRPGPKLLRPRVGHAAILLHNGSVLVFGGWVGSSDPTATGELYDAGRGEFVPVRPMTSPRGGFTATRLKDGRVLVTGGTDGTGELRSAELFDPVTWRFSRTGSMRVARAAQAATLLSDGRMLVTGGSAGGRVLASAELYEPRTGRFSPAGRMTLPRYKHALAPLAAGRALVVGGSNERDFFGRYASAEVFDLRTRRFRRVGSMAEARFKLADAVARLPSGRVLIAGGGRRVEVYDAGRRRFRRAGLLGLRLAFSTATVLPDGRVLVAGGYDDRIAVTARAWVVSG